MKYLLDTHAFIWWRDQYEKLSPTVLEILQQEEHSIFLSLATIWEMQIKLQTGKMQLKQPLERIIAEEQTKNRFILLPIALNHIWAIGQLPLYHRDPFDRLLAAQAQVEQAILLTTDPAFAHYPIATFW